MNRAGHDHARRTGIGWISRLFAFLAVHGFILFGSVGAAAEWQWSVPMEQGRAFLWIPPHCGHVRAVLIGQNNLIEQGVLEHRTMRTALAELGIAEVFVAPPFDNVFQFARGAGEKFEAMMRELAAESGYGELAGVPVIPMGHSACASFPWNFAAWNPQRTLAILSVKGDAPQTNLTGSGKPNPEWDERSIDGIPGLMVMSEYEWWEDRLAPLIKFRAAHPKAPIALLADVGHGHFDAFDSLVEFLALFIRKAANARMADRADMPGSALPGGRGVSSVRSDTGKMPVLLKSIDPAQGWLVDRWRGDELLRAKAALVAEYRGDRTEAFWCFDEEMARATEAAYAASRGKKRQQVDFLQSGELVPIANSHSGIELKFLPLEDGVTFRLKAAFIAPLPPPRPIAAKDASPPPRFIAPEPAQADQHASGDVLVSRATGPVSQLDAMTFQVAFDRTASTNDRRSREIWFVASHPGDATYKSAVQQAVLKVPRNTNGAEQHLTFPVIADQIAGTARVKLKASSDADLPVSYYVREGPVEIDGDTLRLTAIPPRAKFPIKVTIVAWQLGRAKAPSIKTAEPVERTFVINR